MAEQEVPCYNRDLLHQVNQSFIREHVLLLILTHSVTSRLQSILLKKELNCHKRVVADSI